MRKLASVLGLASILGLASVLGLVSVLRLEPRDHVELEEVYDAFGQRLELILPDLAQAAEPHVEEYTVETRDILLNQIRESAVATELACSGKKFHVEGCAKWWTKDVTVYDMLPPNGVARGRSEWEARLRKAIVEEPHDAMKIQVQSAGWIPHNPDLAYSNGFWAKFLNGKVSHHGRYSAVMKQQGGHWKFHIVSTIRMDNNDDWVPVKNGQGGNVRIAAQNILRKFAHGYNHRNYKLAFSDYSLHAKFPFMKELGGTSLAFAVTALDAQKRKLAPVHLAATVDEAKVIGNDKLTAVAHGFSKMTDGSSKMYTMGRFSFLVILERDTVESPWCVKYDFSPNNWLLAPTVH